MLVRPSHLLTQGNVFPTWHRPYVALYEQSIADRFPEIITAYESKNRGLGLQILDASLSWRLPYWDWAINSNVPPEWNAPTISIWGYDGKPESVINPLVAYRFQKLNGYGFEDQFLVFPTTLRTPDGISATAKSQPALVDQWMAKGPFREHILDLFPTPLFQPDPWGQFSNHTWNRIPGHVGTLTSLESIHDSVHRYVGGYVPPYGDMALPDYAAFDPIFWLHHCNVDRLLDLWMAGHPTIFVSPGPNLDGICWGRF
jgi:tyrosinase